MMSKILRWVISVFFGLALIWTFLWWPTHPVLAIVGGFGLIFAFVPILGIQFLLLWRVNQSTDAPRASLMQHVEAWWSEVKLLVRVFMVQQAFQEHRFKDTSTDTKPLNNTESTSATDLQTPTILDQSENIAKKQRGVVFIHGFLCNRGFWNPWLERLQRLQSLQSLQSSPIPFIALCLEPVFTSIDDYAPMIEQAVVTMTAQQGRPPLLICHSMGGLAARAWLRANPGSAARVSHIVTIGTPHHGTLMVRFKSFVQNATQMQKNSEWITTLARDENARQPGFPLVRQPDSISNASASNPYLNFTCYYSNCDNIVFPTLTAALDGANNRFVPGQAHVQMAFDETVMRESLARL